MTRNGFKVGEVANRTGVSIRALHYYDGIGLLRPSSATGSGHRLYSAGDVARLQHIKLLQQLGFSLSDIGEVLNGRATPFVDALRKRIACLQEQMALQKRLCDRLESIANRLDAAGTATIEELLDSVKEIEMIEKHYSQEQLDYLAKRKEQVGDERIQQVQQEWHDLIAAVRTELESGTEPTSEPMQKLAAKWQGLIDEFTGGDKGVEQSLGNMYAENPNAAAQYGYNMDAELFEYVGKAIAKLRKNGNG